MKNSSLKSCFALLLALAAFAVLPARADVKLDMPLPQSPLLTKGKLPNGLTYYIQKNGKPANRAEMRLVVRAGSILEDEDQQGLAHFTEHMAFNGTTHFKKHELISFLQSIGVKFGADLNAYTSFDETVYILPIPTDKAGNLEKGLDVLEDWAGGLSFDPDEIDRERGVVLEESRLGKGANDRMNKIIWPKVFEGSKYADRLPIGKDDILKNFKHASLKRFYADWYRPDLMAVIVVGDIDPAAVEKMIKTRFSKLKNPAHERPRLYAGLPDRTNSDAVVATDKEMTNNVVQVLYARWPDHGEVKLGDYRQSLIQRMFNTMLSQRLQELTQTANPPFIVGNSGVNQFVRGYKQFSSFAVLGKGGLEPATDALVQENQRAARYGFTANELERTKKSMLRNSDRSYSERDKTESSSFVGEFIRNFLVDEAVPGIANEWEYVKQLLPTITLDDVNQFARQVAHDSDKKLAIYLGSQQAGAVLPTNPVLMTAFVSAEKKDVTPYQEKNVAASLMATPPAPGKIVGEKTNAALGLTELKLDNGVTVILKQTDFKNDQVLMSAYRKGGVSRFADADFYSAEYAAYVVRSMGAGNFSPTDLQKMLAGKTVAVAPYINDLLEGLSGQSGSADLETMLQMTHLYFVQPRKDTELFQSYIGKNQDATKNTLARPENMFWDKVMAKQYDNNLRAPHVAKPADFGKIDLERVMAIYHERFASARGYTFYFVGSFDPARIKPLIATYLGSLPGADTTSGFKDSGLRPIKGVHKVDERMGLEQKSLVLLTFTGEAPYSPAARLQMNALLEVLNIRFVERFREDMGVVYGAHAGGGLVKDPYNHFAIDFAIPCGPDNTDKLIAAALDEVAKLKADGPRAQDLDKVKENWLKSYRENIKTNDYWLSTLVSTAQAGEDPALILSYEARVRALQPADIQAAARTYFSLDNYMQSVMYPAAK